MVNSKIIIMILALDFSLIEFHVLITSDFETDLPFCSADIHKVERDYGLGKSDKEIPKILFVVQTAIVAHFFAELVKVGVRFGNNSYFTGVGTALPENSRSQVICRLFAAFSSLLDEVLFELSSYA